MATTQARMFQRRRTAAQWSSENPTLADGEIGYERDTRLFKFGDGATAWTTLPYANQIAELVADEPAEVDLVTVGDTTTISLLDSVARRPQVYGSGQYYWSIVGTSSGQTLTQDQAVFIPIWLQAGTLDRLGVEVSTAVAATTVRYAVYTDSGGLPATLVVEGSAAATTTGLKESTISAALPANGRYWLAVVAQGAAGVGIQGGPSTGPGNGLCLPLGTNSANATGTGANYSRLQNGITGAFPTTATVTNSPSGIRARWVFRYA